MNDTCFLILDKTGIVDMKKTQRGAENLKRGEFAVKLEVEVDEKKLNKPFPTRKIQLEPWDKNLAIEDPHVESPFITKKEEQMLREHRIQNHIDVLEDLGYEVNPKEIQQGQQ